MKGDLTMNNFKYYAPTEVVFGKDAEKETGVTAKTKPLIKQIKTPNTAIVFLCTIITNDF